MFIGNANKLSKCPKVHGYFSAQLVMGYAKSQGPRISDKVTPYIIVTDDAT